MDWLRSLRLSFSFQSTRPRGTRLQQCLTYVSSNQVSIHAPTRDATRTDCLIPKYSLVSIHAPTRDATMKHSVVLRMHSVSIHAPTRDATSASSTPKSIQNCFNPRAHEGRDGRSGGQLQGLLGVSIHAPTRDATFCTNTDHFDAAFQSTRPRGTRQEKLGRTNKI